MSNRTLTLFAFHVSNITRVTTILKSFLVPRENEWYHIRNYTHYSRLATYNSFIFFIGYSDNLSNIAPFLYTLFSFRP